MPNWCWVNMVVEGKNKDIEQFCKHLIFEDIEPKAKYFARSFANTTWEDFKKEQLGFNGYADFSYECAWSVTSCLIDGYPQGDNELITLMDACKEHKVYVEIESSESGVGFWEHIICDENGVLIKNECEDMPNAKCLNCGEIQLAEFPDELEEMDCYECGENKWRLLDNE